MGRFMSRRFINCNVVHELLIFYPTIFSILKETPSYSGYPGIGGQ
jgi:hypothetical protein